MIKAVCFDLDGTLLPMDIDEFCRYYFGLLARRLSPLGYDPKALIDAVLSGSEAMGNNDGYATNEEVFWADFCRAFGKRAAADKSRFLEFYKTDFDKARAVCGFDPDAAPAVRACKDAGLAVCLATQPVYPRIATEKRIRWAGLDPADFAFFTTYEDCRFCKPAPGYFKDVAARLGLAPAECLMVGNDADEDLAAADAGMQVFLLRNDYLLNKSGKDLSCYPQGDFSDLIAYIDTRLRG